MIVVLGSLLLACCFQPWSSSTAAPESIRRLHSALRESPIYYVKVDCSAIPSDGLYRRNHISSVRLETGRLHGRPKFVAVESFLQVRPKYMIALSSKCSLFYLRAYRHKRRPIHARSTRAHGIDGGGVYRSPSMGISLFSSPPTHTHTQTHGCHRPYS